MTNTQRTLNHPFTAIGVIMAITVSILMPVNSFMQSGMIAQAAERESAPTPPAQTLVVADVASQPIVRDAYTITKPPPPPPPKPTAPHVTANPGSAQAIAQGMVSARGWGDGEFNCLVSLWNKESGWRVNAANPSSGAYGIPQSLPGNKMASAGADWQTNPATQITWGLNYIQGRYGSPCGAWSASQSKGWY